MDIQKLLAAFTLRQKIAYCTGADSWHTRAFPSKGQWELLMGGPVAENAPPAKGFLTDTMAKGLVRLANGRKRGKKYAVQNR